MGGVMRKSRPSWSQLSWNWKRFRIHEIISEIISKTISKIISNTICKFVSDALSKKKGGWDEKRMNSERVISKQLFQEALGMKALSWGCDMAGDRTDKDMGEVETE